MTPGGLNGADHNDPNAVNSIFSDIPLAAADLYDMFGFPSDDTTAGESVVLALTFAPVPETGVFDTDLLYRILIDPDRRITRPSGGEPSLEMILDYARTVNDRYLHLEASEIRIRFDAENRAVVDFIDFPGGSFSEVVETNEVRTVDTPDGHSIKAYIGGRDDAFFNDLPGFFRSINYAPQYFLVPQAMAEARELEIPKTLLELEGNTMFNFDPANPDHGHGMKKELPPGPWTWDGDKFLQDENGNYRFVYSGRDAQAGFNINALIFEIPLAFLTENPTEERIVNAWGESWVLKAANKVEMIPDDETTPDTGNPWLLPGVIIGVGVLLLVIGLMTSDGGSGWASRKVRITAGLLLVLVGVGVGMVTNFLAGPQDFDDELLKYKRVDTDGQAFADAALNVRRNDRQLGANNIATSRDLVRRLAHLGWGFSPSIKALGLASSFDDDDVPVSVHKTHDLATTAFPRVKKALFQELNMPDDSWNKNGLDISLKRSFEIFIPNVNAVDMDTTGTWPFGRRLEDQVATRFLSVFLDMEQMIGDQQCHIDILGDQALWDSAPIEPKTPPNPLKNDKEFLDQFPYLADPW